MLKPRVPKSRPDLYVHLKDVAEKQVPAKLKPILGSVTDSCSSQNTLALAATGYGSGSHPWSLAISAGSDHHWGEGGGGDDLVSVLYPAVDDCQARLTWLLE